MRKLSTVWATALILCTSVLASESVSVRYETRLVQSNTVSAGTMYLSGKKMKISQAASQDVPASEIIFRGDRQVLWIIDHNRKSYVQMDKESLEKMSAQFAGVYEKMEKQLASLPPAQRKQMEKLLKNQLPMEPSEPAPPKELRETGENRVINGYPCVRYDFYEADQLDTEIWLTTKAEFDTDSMSEAMRSMGEFYAEFARRVPQMRSQSQLDFEALGKVKGFPILVRNYDDGELVSETSMTNIAPKPLSDDFFEVTPGYKKTSFGR